MNLNVLANNLHLILPAAAGLATVGTLTALSVAPRCGAWGKVLYRGPMTNPARIALTFDDGPTEGSTDRILDVLGEMNVSVAFFVVGVNARRWPRLVERMHAEGHLVGNHSLDHSHYGFLRGRWYWRRQIERTNEIIEQIIGRRPALFRPPMGVKTPSISGAARRAGHRTVTWTLRGMDGVPTTPQRILDRLLPHAGAGDVLVLHDGVEPNRRRDPSVTVDVMQPLLQGLRSRRLELARLDRLLGVEPYLDQT